jgi:DNA-binding NarL/FixJ family response regulator
MAQLLNLQGSLHLCCEASNAEEAVAAMASCLHDLTIVDISLDGDSWLELIKTLRHRYPALAILVMSMHDESPSARCAPERTGI